VLRRLVGDAALRREVGRAALHDVLHRFGPDGRRHRIANVLHRVLGTAAQRAAAFAVELERGPREPRLPIVPGSEVIRAHGADRVAAVAVVIPLYNYERYVVDALESVAEQSLDDLELVVVDDCSTDRSLAVVTDWLAGRWRRFVRATILRNRGNQGLPLTRNVGFTWAEAPLVFPLDADNRLAPDCLELLCGRLDGSAAAAVHPTLQRFGGCTYRHAAQPWSPDRLRHGNYIDAMALIRKSGWSHVGGYTKGDFVGWEDYELWCKFVEHSLWSEPVPEAVAFYRVHGESMLSTRTNAAGTRTEVVRAIHREHPWLRVRAA
jgi:GT2 family glycosyltransferase